MTFVAHLLAIDIFKMAAIATHWTVGLVFVLAFLAAKGAAVVDVLDLALDLLVTQIAATGGGTTFSLLKHAERAAAWYALFRHPHLATFFDRHAASAIEPDVGDRLDRHGLFRQLVEARQAAARLRAQVPVPGLVCKCFVANCTRSFVLFRALVSERFAFFFRRFSFRHV
jgi:hypothetical protein